MEYSRAGHGKSFEDGRQNNRRGRADVWRHSGEDTADRVKGIRVRSLNYVPTITLCTTSTPILPWVGYPPNGAVDKKNRPYVPDDFRWGRYISHSEAAKLQSMQELEYTGLSRLQKFQALGNAVNVDVVELIARRFLP